MERHKAGRKEHQQNPSNQNLCTRSKRRNCHLSKVGGKMRQLNTLERHELVQFHTVSHTLLRPTDGDSAPALPSPRNLSDMLHNLH